MTKCLRLGKEKFWHMVKEKLALNLLSMMQYLPELVLKQSDIKCYFRMDEEISTD